ncbi:MAG: type II toxin-antitoxin system prevent-host-death family antitoxin [Desulfobacterales bacterium]|jgi:prevent-host-death family protein
MTITISAMEARKKFGEILNKVSLLNEEIIIERAGKKIARIVPLEYRDPRSKEKLDFRQAAGLGREFWKGIDVAEYIKSEREAWD